jgi:ERCC4-type nuclease
MSTERKEIEDFLTSLKKNRDLSAFAKPSQNGKKQLNQLKEESMNTSNQEIGKVDTIIQLTNFEIEQEKTSNNLTHQFFTALQSPSSLEGIAHIKADKLNEKSELSQSKTEKTVKPKADNKTSSVKQERTHSPKVFPMPNIPVIDHDFMAHIKKAHEQGFYTFQAGKRFLIDDQNYKALMKMRYEYDLKSVSVLINTLISAFVAQMPK